jgi:YbgC/YbaW family acyl-CoA thioester hydrolase
MRLHEFTTHRRIEFADTDMGGIVHFSRYFVFMETAEHQLFEAIGTSIHLIQDGRAVGWPRVAATCEYRSPARFGDVLDLRVRLVRKGRTSLTWDHQVSVGGRLVANGRISSICCYLDGPAGLEPIPLPAIVADRLTDNPDEATP